MLKLWRQLDPAWRFAIGVYLVARVALSAWALVIFLLFPSILQNLDLFGMPALAYFDLASGERYVYARRLADGTTLTFRAGERWHVVDAQSGSVWSLREGRAVSGKYAGRALDASVYSVEDVFPYRGVAPSQNILLSVWQRFDTNWYLKIAQRGYAERADDGSTVYFPLYPLLIRAVGTLLLGHDLLAALLVSNLAVIGVFYWLYQMAIEIAATRTPSRPTSAPSREVAASSARAVAYLVIFPTAFFLFAAYTESLFLLFALASLREGMRARWGRAGVFGALAALTRLQGALLVVPLVYLWWKWGAGSRQQAAGSKQQAAGVALLLIPLATATFLALTNLSLLASYEGQLHARFVMPWENVWTAVTLLASGQGSFIDALNLLATLGFGVMLFVVWHKMPREFTFYALLMFLAPLFRMTTTQPLVSMSRYVLALFPVFIVWGAWGRNAWMNRAIVYLSFPLHLFLSAQFVMWGWVG